MHPTPPPPTSAGEWAAWVIAILCAAAVAQAGVIAWLFRDQKADGRLHADALARVNNDRVAELQDTVKAVAPSSQALATLHEKVAVVVQRVDAHDERHDRHEERASKLEERVDRWEERTPMPRRSQR